MSLCPDTVAAPQHGVWESYFGSGVYGHEGGLSSYRSSLWLLDDRMACWTSIRITTSRSIMPKIGGFSFSKVPRPPFTLLRRPFGPHRLGIALVPSDNVELVELNVAAQDHLGCLRHDAVTQHHGLGVALAQF